MKQIILAVPHSHSWLWVQTCLASLKRHPPIADGCEIKIVVVDNSDWSPAILGVSETSLGKDVNVIANHKSNKWHGSGLDCALEKFSAADYLMAFETDVLALKDGWLQWFMSRMAERDYAVGHWHHEQFINPSCTLYRMDVLQAMAKWVREYQSTMERWGDNFERTKAMDDGTFRSLGPFAEKRGWPEGTQLAERPSGQVKGPGWYEPGQALHAWARNEGWTYTVVQTHTDHKAQGFPVQTFYGLEGDTAGRSLEPHEIDGRAQTVHLWGGTRALDIIKHKVECPFVGANTPFWLQREAKFWLHFVPEDVRKQTLDLIRKYGFHYRGQGTPDVTDRDREAAAFVIEQYRIGGVEI